MLHGERILIFGGSGMLGRAVTRTLAPYAARMQSLNSHRGRITDVRHPSRIAMGFAPTWVVNCAAYTDVDGCERDPKKAFDVNGLGAGTVALAARANDSKLIHISTDYVFPGDGDTPIVESEKPLPVNVYGESKLNGEKRVMGILPTACILRVGWLYGRDKKTYVDEQIRRAGSGEPLLPSFTDQYGVPTDTDFVARAVLKALLFNLSGVFHVALDGYCSRWEQSAFVAKAFGREDMPPATRTETANLSAKRPRFTALDSSSFRRITSIIMPSWEEKLSQHIQRYRNSKSL